MKFRTGDGLETESGNGRICMFWEADVARQKCIKYDFSESLGGP